MQSKYDLLANIVHDGKAGEGSYRVHIHRKVQMSFCSAASTEDVSGLDWDTCVTVQYCCLPKKCMFPCVTGHAQP